MSRKALVAALVFGSLSWMVAIGLVYGAWLAIVAVAERLS